jgi:hypothetical protein
MLFKALTTVILAAHFGFLIYLVSGGFLAWRWPRALWPHLAAGLWGGLVIVAHLRCPLTAAEQWSRHRAGQAGQLPGFIDRYIEGVIYPERYTGVVQAVAALLVAGSWLGGYAMRRRRKRSADTGAKSEGTSKRTATV